MIKNVRIYNESLILGAEMDTKGEKPPRYRVWHGGVSYEAGAFGPGLWRCYGPGLSGRAILPSGSCLWQAWALWAWRRDSTGCDRKWQKVADGC